MAIKEILLLGNQNLYKTCEKIKKEELSELSSTVNDLYDTMMEFKRKHNWGRAIAAPQINIYKRLIYMHAEKPMVFINPKITYKSNDTFEVWDDCMSFPNLMVKVHRHKSIKVKYFDMNWNSHEVELNDDLSELFQHEYDHLDGILAVMRAVDKYSLSCKSEYNKFYKK
jgi:peptide deformylase